MKKKIFILIFAITIFPLNCIASTVLEQQKAVITTAEAFYNQKGQLQYDSYRKNLYSTPEDATSKHNIYTVCSGFTFMTYYQSLGINIPDTTDELLDYAEKYKNTENVIFYYGSKSEIYKNGVLGAVSDTVTATEKQNFVNSIINKVKPGDIFVYTKDSSGHAVLIKSVDTKNKKIYIMESTGERYDYDNHADVLEPNGSIVTNVDFTTELMPNRTRMALIRVITDGKSYKSFDGQNISYDITESAKTRMQYPNIDIGKIINNVGNQSFASLGDELTYQLVIKNNSSSSTYTNLSVVENVDSRLSIISSGGGSISNNNISWNISSLAPGKQITLLYTVKIPINYNLLGKIFTSTGKVNNIATSRIETRIDKRLSVVEKNKLKETFNKLKDKNDAKSSRDFINILYKEALGIDLGISSLTNLSVMQYDSNAKTAGGSKLAVKYTKFDEKWTKYLYSNYYGLRLAGAHDASKHYVRANAAWNLYPKFELNDRARILTPAMLEDGDVILAYVGKDNSTDTNLANKGYLYLNGTLYRYGTSIKSFSTLTGDSLKTFLNRLMGENYIILRPTLTKMIGISISKLPSNTTYIQNKGNLDLTGGELNINYDDGSIKKVDLNESNVKVSGFNNSTLGNNKINVTYEGYSTSFNVEIVSKEIKDIIIGKLPMKTKYLIDKEQLDLTGGELNINYNDGSVEKINLNDNKVKVSGFNNSTLGNNKINVTYEGYSTSFNVEIVSKKEKSIIVSKLPLKTKYIINKEQLDLTGGELKVNYDDGSSEIISLKNNRVNVTKFDNTNLGKNTLIVEYAGLKTSFNIEIINSNNNKIVLLSKPLKTIYYYNEESLDLTGGVIGIIQTDGKTENIGLDNENVKVSGFNNKILGINVILVEYEKQSLEFTVEIIEKKVEEIKISTLPTKTNYITALEDLDLTGGIITAVYEDGTLDYISLTNDDVIVSGFDNAINGSNELMVQYRNVTTSFFVNIVDKKISGISISRKPTKLSYIQNKEKLDLTSGIITISYDDGTTDEMSLTNPNILVSGFDNTKEGNNNIEITYADHKANFSVQIIKNYEMKDNGIYYVIGIVTALIILIITLLIKFNKKRKDKNDFSSFNNDKSLKTNEYDPNYSFEKEWGIK